MLAKSWWVLGMLVVRRFYITISVFGALVGVAVEAEMPEPDFAQEVLILSERPSHGPDAKKDERKTPIARSGSASKGKQAINRKSWRTVFCLLASRTKKIRCLRLMQSH